MEFNSQICTTKEQSERLLALGLKAETADMTRISANKFAYTIPYVDAISFSSTHRRAKFSDVEPAWSLHRLMCLCPTDINRYDFYVSHDYVHYHNRFTGYNDEEPVGFYKDNPFDSLIDCIEWLIKEGHFNKEYLEEVVI